MDKKVRLQIRVLLLIVKLISGIHLKEEYQQDLDGIRDQLKDMTE
ncbi:hypothetical protein LCGC14_1952670 [marine sediment metagenome]|uniref:Uncharacterized protein n=1 Tax=marine sediment metagenome TaxID=412755 RepID=A0A0F9G5A7_9ZZZZ